MISGARKVVVPVDDQERAKQFWTTLDSDSNWRPWMDITLTREAS